MKRLTTSWGCVPIKWTSSWGHFVQEVQHQQWCVELWGADVWDMVTGTQTISWWCSTSGRLLRWCSTRNTAPAVMCGAMGCWCMRYGHWDTNHFLVVFYKWASPEVVFYKKYSTSSDVWSYGMLMHEIWSLGHQPFEIRQWMRSGHLVCNIEHEEICMLNGWPYCRLLCFVAVQILPTIPPYQPSDSEDIWPVWLLTATGCPGAMYAIMVD